MSEIVQHWEAFAWSWVDSVQDCARDITQRHVSMAYRLHFPVHLHSLVKCRKNCKTNPRCYSALGESRWLSQQAQDPTMAEDEDADQESAAILERRPPNLPAGLKNLGNTCYVNSFLQILFHNVTFRETMYKWAPTEDAEERSNDTLLQAGQYRPKGKVASLQALFAMMDFTNRRAVDPNDLVSKLGLDPQVQQDAQEFSKLFMALLESSLSTQSNEQVRSLVQNQFCGEYAYVTTCCNCGRESCRASCFYELDLPLQGNKTVRDCLEVFFKKEKLDGPNQYYCEQCAAKQDASRCVRLIKLPPVLNLSLNRFIFDMQTGRKKKLNSYVHFPEKLDMSAYFKAPSKSVVYSLSGVLMHVGAEANHGHYIAHIQEPRTCKWYKFSDSLVQELESNPSQLGLVDAETAAPKSRGEKTPGSNSAYMLVYTVNQDPLSIAAEKHGPVNGISSRKRFTLRQDSNSGQVKCSLKAGTRQYPTDFPLHLKTYIDRDRDLLDQEIAKNEVFKMDQLNDRVALHNRMRDLCPKLGYLDEQMPFEFVPTKWLQKFLASPTTVSPIDFSSMLCVHGNVNLCKLNDLKVVNETAADQMYELSRSDNTDRLAARTLCSVCVINRCRNMKLSRSLNEDSMALLKIALKKSNDNYWVGKDSFKRWKTLAKEEMDKQIILCGQNKTNHTQEPDGDDDAKMTPEQAGEQEVMVNGNGHHQTVSSQTENEEASDVTMPLDVISEPRHKPCQQRLKFNDDIVCIHGHLSLLESRRRLVSAEAWAIFKKYFANAKEFHSDCSPCSSCTDDAYKKRILLEENRELALAQKSALAEIFSKRNRPSWLKNKLHKVHLISKDFVQKWRQFIRNPSSHGPLKCLNNRRLICEHEKLLYPMPTDAESEKDSMMYIVTEEEWLLLSTAFEIDEDIVVLRTENDFMSEPVVCDECVARRLERQQEDLLQYRKAIVFVRQISNLKNLPSSESSDLLTADPDFEDHPNAAKRFKACIDEPDTVRRSNRRQRVREEQGFVVSSNTLLRDFKLMLMDTFHVATYDQNLYLDSVPLNDTSLTLGQLKVLPCSTIYLQADEPCAEAEADPEEGFKGTGLVNLC